MKKKQDDGFMLIELLVTIAIMGVVFSSVAAIAVVVFKAKGEANQALQNSNDMQVVSTYFGDDVAGSTNSPPAGSLGTLALSGTDFSTGTWSHTYQLDTSTHVMTRDGVPIASNIYSASFTPGAAVWTLSIDGCVLPTCATGEGAPNTITATRRI